MDSLRSMFWIGDDNWNLNRPMLLIILSERLGTYSNHQFSQYMVQIWPGKDADPFHQRESLVYVKFDVTQANCSLRQYFFLLFFWCTSTTVQRSECKLYSHLSAAQKASYFFPSKFRYRTITMSFRWSVVHCWNELLP